MPLRKANATTANHTCNSTELDETNFNSRTTESNSSKKRKRVRDPPQRAINSFWDRFLSPTPLGASHIFPEALYSTILPNHKDPDRAFSSRNAVASYESAAQECRERVQRIVKECRRTNTKFTDAEFDIQSDFSSGRHNCLRAIYERYPEWTEDCYVDDDEDSDDGTSSDDKQPATKPKSRPLSVHRVSWIFQHPKFLDSYEFDGTDGRQGAIGDCWWLAAVTTLCSVGRYMDKVCVVQDEDYGVYGFVFFRDGEWVPTVIDDFLYLKAADWLGGYDPHGDCERKYRADHQTGSNALFFSACTSQNETWLPLLEKAYAKVHGDYAAIDFGSSGEGVEDMTGGVTTSVYTDDILDRDQLWRDLRSRNKEFLFSVCTRSRKKNEDSKHGLSFCHYYSILRAIELPGETGGIFRLVQIR